MSTHAKLTPIEREVMRLLCAGRTPKQVGDALKQSRRNVHNHLTKIKDKLGAHTSWQAAAVFALIHQDKAFMPASDDLTRLPWWSKGAWQAPQVVPVGSGPVVEFNPYCKHARTSYDIVNCDACLDYSRKMEQLRREAAAAVPAEQGARAGPAVPTVGSVSAVTCPGGFWEPSFDNPTIPRCSICKKSFVEHR